MNNVLELDKMEYLVVFGMIKGEEQIMVVKLC